MSLLRLWFSSQNSPELIKTHFEHSLLAAPCVSIRGRSLGAYRNVGTFQWTSAVQAICVLFLRASAYKGQLHSDPLLQGGSGSLASSLDFCLTKLPQWLIEMFGKDRHDTALVRRLIHRSNIGLKRSGPVALTLGDTTAKELKIEVYVGEKLVEDCQLCTDLASLIEHEWRPHHNHTRTGSLQKPHEATRENQQLPVYIDPLMQRFSVMVRDEVLHALRVSEVFSVNGYKQALRDFEKHAGFVKLAGKKATVSNTLAEEILGKEDRNLLLPNQLTEYELRRDPPIRVSLCVVPSATTVLFSHLINVHRYNIELDTTHCDPIEIVNQIENGSFATPPDLITLGIASVAQVISKLKLHGYVPIMPTPKHSARIIGIKSTYDYEHKTLSRGRYACLCDMPSSGTFYLDALTEQGVINEKQVRIEHADPGQIFQELKDGDPDLKAIVHFPHHQLNVLFNNAHYLDSARLTESYFPGALFAHESFLAQHRRALAIVKALMCSWLELREGGIGLDQAIERLLYTDNFIQRMGNSAGMQLTPPTHAAPLLKAASGRQ